MNGLHGLQWAAIASAYSLGLALAVWPELKAYLVRRLALTAGQGDALLAARYLTFIPLTFVSGLLVDVWGMREVFGLGTLVTALALFALAVGQTYRGCLGAALLAGAGLSGMSCGAVALMPVAFFTNDAPAALNLGFIFAGLGALLTPALIASLTRSVGPRRSFILVATACLVPAALVSLVPDDAVPLTDTATSASGLIGDPIVWLAGLALACYSPLESVLEKRAATHLADLACPPRRLTAALALIWAAFLMGRLGMALFLHRDWLNPVADGWLLLMLAVWSAVALGNAAGSHTPAGATGALVLVGACLGPILPTLVGIALKEAGPAAYGTAYGIVSAVGVTGGLALAPLFRGTAARGKALRGAPLIISGLLLAAACAALALVAER